ncbi:MAG: diguanylate cyclase [Candidatus Eremiobacteraeota bacterium]|nr:diguanylate cyclase [Candidatus Eremiobacteraeota bacterium]
MNLHEGVAGALDPRDTMLDMLLGQIPPPQALAMDENGLVVAMPAAVPVQPSQYVKPVGSALEFFQPADFSIVIDAWERVRSEGSARAVAHLRMNPTAPVTLHFIDARHRYGVFLGFFVGMAGTVEVTDGGLSLFRPRSFTTQRNELSVILDADDAATKILGWSREELIGARTRELVHPDDRASAIANWMEMLARPGSTQRSLLRHRHRDGNYVWLESTHHNLLHDASVGRVVSQIVDVTDRMEAIEALRASEQLLRRLTEALPIGIVQIDAERRIVHANERLHTIVGASGAATIDELFERVSNADRAALDTAIRLLLIHAIPADVEVSIEHPEGLRRCSLGLRALTTGNGTVSGAIASVADITEGMQLREELRIRATFDPLTGCRNRAAILETLASLRRSMDGPRTGIAALFVDLDRFKEINDRFGHAVGDEVLRRVAKRLSHSARPSDIVGRLGGDEFLIICPDVASPQWALQMAERIACSIAKRTVIGSLTIDPSASIGVAWTDLPMDADTLVAHADAAMYDSKRRANGPALFEAV